MADTNITGPLWGYEQRSRRLAGLWPTSVYEIPVLPPPTKALFGYGVNASSNFVSITNLVSNTGVVAADVTGVGTARGNLAAAAYGTSKAIFGYGTSGASVSITNLVSDTGVVATDTTGVGTARSHLAAAGYATNNAIFGYGIGPVSLTNKVHLLTPV